MRRDAARGLREGARLRRHVARAPGLPRHRARLLPLARLVDGDELGQPKVEEHQPRIWPKEGSIARVRGGDAARRR